MTLEQQAREIWPTCNGKMPYNIFKDHGLSQSITSKCCEFHTKLAAAFAKREREIERAHERAQEAGRDAGRLYDESATLRARRDALMAALEKAEKWLRSGERTMTEVIAFLQQVRLRAALAAEKGEE